MKHALAALVSLASLDAHAYLYACDAGETLVPELTVLANRECPAQIAVEFNGDLRCVVNNSGAPLRSGLVYRACVSTDRYQRAVVSRAEGHGAE